MQPDPSERAERLILAADLPPREQAEFLDSACDRDPDLACSRPRAACVRPRQRGGHLSSVHDEANLLLEPNLSDPGIISLYRESPPRTEALLREAARQQ